MEHLEIMFNTIKSMKMRLVKYMYWAGAVLMTLGLTQTAAAQGSGVVMNSPASIELLKAGALWLNSGNGAGMTLDKLPYYSDLNFIYGRKTGDFKMKHEGETERMIGFATEGGLSIGKGYVWGSFEYDNEALRNTLYNTTMLDPLRGIPYYTVDKNLSDWLRQAYTLSMKAASAPLWDRVIIGIEADYIAKVGAKQIDPRSEADYYTINVKPSIVLNFGTHSVGLNLRYQNLKQESKTTNSDSQTNQDVFVLKGLGNGYSAVVGGLQSLGTFLYEGNTAGGALQYYYASEGVKILLSGKYNFRVEDVVSAPSKPKKEGSVKENELGIALGAVLGRENISRFDVEFNKKDMSGIEFVQYLDNSYEVQRWITIYSSIRSTFADQEFSFRYNFFRGAGREYRWRAGAGLSYNVSDDLYIIPESLMKVENLYLGANAKYNLKLKEHTRILAGVDYIYKNNLSGNFAYGGAEPESHIITDFMTPDFQYLKESFSKIGGTLSYFTSVSKNNTAGMFVKASLDYYMPTESENNRTQFSIGFGFTF